MIASIAVEFTTARRGAGRYRFGDTLNDEIDDQRDFVTIDGENRVMEARESPGHWFGNRRTARRHRRDRPGDHAQRPGPASGPCDLHDRR